MTKTLLFIVLQLISVPLYSRICREASQQDIHLILSRLMELWMKQPGKLLDVENGVLIENVLISNENSGSVEPGK